MKSIANKWYWFGVYIGLALCLVFFFSLLYFTIFYVDGWKGQAAMVLTGVIWVLFIFYLFRELLKVVSIQITNQGILVATSKEVKTIGWRDIREVSYYRRNGFMQMDTITISAIDLPQDVKIHTNYFANSHELVQAIKYGVDSFEQKVYVELSGLSLIKVKPINLDEIRYQNFVQISRLPILNPRTYFPLVGLFGLYKLITAPSIHLFAIIMFVAIILISFLIGTLGMGRIGVSDKFIVLASYYYPYRKYFRLSDIDCIYIERPTNSGLKSVRVLTLDGKQKLFPLDNLLKADWDLLADTLAKNGLRVVER